RSDDVRTCLEERILRDALAFAAKIDGMNEGDVWLDETDLPEQAGQIEAERAVDSAEPIVACEQRLEAPVKVRGRNRKQSGYVEIEANHEPARPRDRSHFAQRIKRANKMAKQKPAVDHIEMIMRQARIVGAGAYGVNIAETICFGTALCDCELVGADVNRGDLALRTDLVGKPSRRVAGPAADVGDAPTARDADHGHDPLRI